MSGFMKMKGLEKMSDTFQSFETSSNEHVLAIECHWFGEHFRRYICVIGECKFRVLECSSGSSYNKIIKRIERGETCETVIGKQAPEISFASIVSLKKIDGTRTTIVQYEIGGRRRKKTIHTPGSTAHVIVFNEVFHNLGEGLLIENTQAPISRVIAGPVVALVLAGFFVPVSWLVAREAEKGVVHKFTGIHSIFVRIAEYLGTSGTAVAGFVIFSAIVGWFALRICRRYPMQTVIVKRF